MRRALCFHFTLKRHLSKAWMASGDASHPSDSRGIHWEHPHRQAPLPTRSRLSDPSAEGLPLAKDLIGELEGKNHWAHQSAIRSTRRSIRSTKSTWKTIRRSARSTISNPPGRSKSTRRHTGPLEGPLGTPGGPPGGPPVCPLGGPPPGGLPGGPPPGPPANPPEVRL